ncbi:Uncharacterised protein [uncultured archaeon]|nr:Uncharacterised protein [uncultured archaeon]
MVHPANKFERRKISLMRSASRGTSRLESSAGSLPSEVRPRVFRSSPKTTMPCQKRPIRVITQGNGGTPRGLVATGPLFHDIRGVEFRHPLEAFDARRKIPYKGKKWELMKKENRKRRAKTILASHLKEFEADPRLKANRNAVSAILSYERIKVKPGKKLIDSLIEKFQKEGNDEAAEALRLGHKLVFAEKSKIWFDSDKAKEEQGRKIKEKGWFRAMYGD